LPSVAPQSRFKSLDSYLLWRARRSAALDECARQHSRALLTQLISVLSGNHQPQCENPPKGTFHGAYPRAAEPMVPDTHAKPASEPVPIGDVHADGGVSVLAFAEPVLAI
jgi:hypothetical protein